MGPLGCCKAFVKRPLRAASAVEVVRGAHLSQRHMRSLPQLGLVREHPRGPFGILQGNPLLRH